jgi:hypothetical protein
MNPVHTILFLYDPFHRHPPAYVLVFLVVAFLLASHQNSIYTPLFPIRATCPPNLILLDFIITL